MGKQTWFDKALEELLDDPEFLTEEMALDCGSEIRRVMAETGISPAELARRLGKSRAYVSKVLNYSPNMTIRSLVLIAHALGARWATPRLVGKQPAAKASQPAGRRPRTASRERPATRAMVAEEAAGYQPSTKRTRKRTV